MKNTVNYDTINSQQNIKNIFTMSKTNFTRKYKEIKHLTLVIRIILSNLIKEDEKFKKKKLPFMSKRTMAKILGVSPQTVLNEI